MSRFWTCSSLAALAVALASIATPGVAATTDPLATYQWKQRVLLVFAPSRDDAMLRNQRALLARMRAGARERDLVMVEAIGDDGAAPALRTAFAVAPGAFGALLIGKDGGAKLRSERPLDADHLFPTIDAMPMRQEEMHRDR